MKKEATLKKQFDDGINNYINIWRPHDVIPYVHLVFPGPNACRMIRKIKRRNWIQIITISIQRTQTPPRLWPLILSCDLDLKSGQKGLFHYMLLIVMYLGTRYDVYRFNFLRQITIILFIVLDLWPSPVTFSFCQDHLHFSH